VRCTPIFVLFTSKCNFEKDRNVLWQTPRTPLQPHSARFLHSKHHLHLFRK